MTQPSKTGPSRPRPGPPAAGAATLGFHPRSAAGADWEQRCGALFEDLRKPARVMIARAFGSALAPDEIDDVYANAWASTLAALRGREKLMSDSELRSYLLTAVANHAGKEMRRRRRRPTSVLEDAHAQVLADRHQPSPEERAVGSESGSLVRDVLASLPRRRRAVMLLRYGWGLEPTEICALVADLSPRAYRKEITRGVGEVIERLGQIDSGDWCRSREPLIRDYVAGTADPDVERQASEHLGHCRACTELVGRLTGELHEIGAGIGWLAASGMVDERLSLGDRFTTLLDRGRETAHGLLARGEEVSDAGAGIAASGGGRGAGALGAGAIAKLAGIGVAGKAAIACVGAGVAATACVATGIVDGPADRDGRDSERERAAAPAAAEADPAAGSGPVAVVVTGTPAAVAPPTVTAGGGGEATRDERGGSDRRGRGEGGSDRGSGGERAASTSPAPAEQQEFGLAGAGGAATSPAPGATASGAASGGGGTGGGSAGGSGGSPSGGGSSGGSSGGAAREFGP